uniref:oxaloacetate tautomerase n=2 Tax=Timema TaxID=61471 RepID=A0A7R9FX09_TIMSH|nr:unnamed protein product [Timema shepardi]CAD7570969.1 unnamed protein product [Timema californicum]
MTNNVRNFVKFGKKIAGAGLNYKSLLAERKLVLPSTPVIFLKPTSSYITEGQSIQVPPNSEVHEEVELGVVIGSRCKKVSEDSALQYVGGYCLALDLTDVVQMKLSRAAGLPWTWGKGFDTACPVSRLLLPEELKYPQDVQLWCRVNGDLRQDCNTADMVFPVSVLISFISHHMTLEPGDLILTGSPAGVGPIAPGDTVQAGLGNILTMTFPVKITD